jgi:hypothetical protein
MKDKKKAKPKSLLEKYNEKQTKGNVENTLLKGGIDAVASSIVGTGIGAIVGDKAPFAGLGLMFLWHYYGDESGVLRVIGASTLAYGIAKAKAYQNNPNLDTAQKRISEAKDDFLTAFHLKWNTRKELTEQKDIANNVTAEVKESIPEKPIKSTVETSDAQKVNDTLDIDLSGLDFFELNNESLADSFEEKQIKDNHQMDIDSEIDDAPDLSLI